MKQKTRNLFEEKMYDSCYNYYREHKEDYSSYLRENRARIVDSIREKYIDIK